MNATLRALNRFGLGARIGEASSIADPKAWLRAQLSTPAGQVAAAATVDPAELAAAFRGGDAAARQQARRRLAAAAGLEQAALLRVRVASDAPFVERLVAFWSNHLTVSSAGKFIVGSLAASYEREAIRPNVLGSFSDMVLASAKHPAMLVYLDNFQSVGPASEAVVSARRPAGGRGLNENYARELLELHTLGVDGGYAQRDVQELASILTGWTVSGVPGAPQPRALATRLAGREIAFRFEPLLHQPGAKTVLTKRYGPGGVAEGEDAIRDLCAHPATAHFVARKLVTHFVSDTPPSAAVERIAAVFRSTDGDLAAVSAELIELDEAWAEESRKFRSPHDWLIAAMRALDGPPTLADRLTPALRQLRQPLWGAPSPKGYGDSVADWADPDSLLNRAELARSMTSRLGRSGPDPARFGEVVEIGGADPLHAILEDRAIPAGERLALAIASPTFQWR